MPRVAKSEHVKIRLMVEAEHRKVPEIAALYGCTPGNIYSILSRLKREDPADGTAEPEAASPPAIVEPVVAAAPPPNAPIVDLFSAPPAAPSPKSATTPAPAPAAAVIERSPPPARGVGTKLAKPGFGFHMRTADGEESVAPYRSLEDLLSAVKGVLRSAARSPDPIWFSVQPIDLATVDSDAA